jgi:accessory gene regulator B
MLDAYIGRIADALSAKKIIKPEDREIYIYGLDALISTVINLAIITALGLILGLFAETAVFMLAFAILRVYAGGYHAKTHLGCTIGFVVTYLTNMALVHHIPAELSKLLALVIAPVSLVLVFVMAPVEHENRPFEGDEYRRFKKISRIVASIEALSATMGIIIIPAYYRLMFCISLAMLNTVIILALAKKIRGKE